MITKPETKQLLADSLRDLLRHKKYDTISVTDIVSNCGMSRHAFYYHFRDKQDLVSWIYLNTRHQAIQFSTTQSLNGNIRRLTQLMMSDASLYIQAHVSDHQNSIHDVILNESFLCLTRLIQDYLGSRSLPAQKTELVARYYAHASVSLLFDQMDKKLDLEDEAFAAYQTEFLEQGLYSTLEKYLREQET